MAYERKEIDIQTRVAIPVKTFKYKVFPDDVQDKYLVTTAGKIIFNTILPDTFQYLADP
jgi:DNA-directed RNA polymerase subunit beta'